MLINEQCEDVGILDLCVAIDELVGCDIDFNDEKKTVTLGGTVVFNGKKAECLKVICGMYIMAMYVKGGFEDLKNKAKEVNSRHGQQTNGSKGQARTKP